MISAHRRRREAEPGPQKGLVLWRRLLFQNDFYPVRETCSAHRVSLTAEQLQMACMIDAKVQRLLAAGNDDVTILTETADEMPAFKRLLDSGQGTMDELCRRFGGFYRYAKVLETVAAGIQSGTIVVPR